MPSKSSVSLPFHLSSITVSGPDAVPFLQSQLTADLERPNRAAWTPAAWCNPKGRALCVLRVHQDDSAVHLALPSAIAGDTLNRLNLYRIGRDVTISVGPMIAPDENGDLQMTDMAAPVDRMHRWFVHEIEQGMPWLLDDTADRFLPQMLGLERIGGLSYRKGCFPGQEIVARVRYRGRLTQRLARFESAAAPPKAGTALTLPSGACTVLYAVETIDTVAGSIGLMVVPAEAGTSQEASEFSSEMRIKWTVVDADHAVLLSGA